MHIIVSANGMMMLWKNIQNLARKKKRKLNLDVIVEEIVHKHTHCTKRQNPPPTGNKQ
jgi:hypothetical protein